MEKLITLGCAGTDELFIKIIEIIRGNTIGSFIDLCCHDARLTKNFPATRKVFVDIFPQEIPEGTFVQADVLGDHSIFQGRFDLALCLDGIEHLQKEDGYKLLKRMSEISDRQILFTPLGGLWLEEETTHPHTHKSGWLPEDVGNEYVKISCPEWHTIIPFGGLFYFKTTGIDKEFERISNAFRGIPELMAS